MRRQLILFLLAVLPARSGTLLTDAFGIADSADPLRAGWAGYRETMSGQGEIVPPGAGAQVQFYLGPKSLVAGQGRAMALALVTDDMGNLVADGSAVDFAFDGLRARSVTTHGLAGRIIGPFTQAGQFMQAPALQGIKAHDRNMCLQRTGAASQRV